MLRRNLVRRINSVERELDRNLSALRRLPSSTPYRPYGNTQRPKFAGGVEVLVDFAIAPDGDNDPLSWTTRPRVGPSTWLYVRATISLANRKWKPTLLGTPDMLRVTWGMPKGWIKVDRVGGNASDEYLVSNPLYLIRVYRSPAGSDRSDKTPSFPCHAYLYEWSWSYVKGAVKEGDG